MLTHIACEHNHQKPLLVSYNSLQLRLFEGVRQVLALLRSLGIALVLFGNLLASENVDSNLILSRRRLVLG